MPPEDPRCPECGTLVGAIDDYCMHCETHLEDPDGRVVATAVIDLESEADADDDALESDAGADTENGWDDGYARGSQDASTTTGTAAGDDRGWLQSDSLRDHVRPAAVGLVVGLPVMALVLLATEGADGFFVGLSCWVAASIYVSRSRTAFGAVRKACYVLAGVLVAVLLFGQGPLVGDVAVFVALTLVGVGSWVGRRAPDG